jgi:hypothetical protein
MTRERAPRTNLPQASDWSVTFTRAVALRLVVDPVSDDEPAHDDSGEIGLLPVGETFRCRSAAASCLQVALMGASIEQARLHAFLL